MNLLTYIFSSRENLLYEMNEEQAVDSWCNSNNWTEPRKLSSGIWVAFPPNGVIETPIPIQNFCSRRTKAYFFLTTLLSGLLLLICALPVVLLAICITPYFWWVKKFGKD